MPWSDYPLRTLVIPGNAGPNDPRIVIDGTTGTISIYGAGGVLLGTIAPDGITFYDPVSGEVTVFINEEGFLAEDPVSGSYVDMVQTPTGAYVLLHGADHPPNDLSAAIIRALDFGGPSFGPLLQIASPRLNGGDDVWLNIIGANPGGPATIDFRCRTNGVGQIQILDDIDMQMAGYSMGIGVLDRAKSTAATVATAAELQDGGVGNIAFTARTGRRYRVTYTGFRCAASANAIAMDLRIRDGGGAAPTTVSPIIAASSKYVAVTGGLGQESMMVMQTLDCPADLAVGTHTIGAFYAKTGGAAGNVSVGQATGAQRELIVEDVGGT